ncbi:hypothetical protein Tco_0846187 [Tanacetum coccineum]
MVHNYYLEEAKKMAQLQKDKALNIKPSVQQSARLPNIANGNKLKPRNCNQQPRNWPPSMSSRVSNRTDNITDALRNQKTFLNVYHGEVKVFLGFEKYVKDVFSSKELINEEDAINESSTKDDHRIVSSKISIEEVHWYESMEAYSRESDQLWASYDPCADTCDYKTKRKDIRNLWAYSYDDKRFKIPWKICPRR